MDTGLAGRVCLVTGASSGLGRHFARLLASHGARVAVAARRVEKLDELCGELGAGAMAVKLDATSVPSIRDAVAAVAARLGPVEVLVNNAGISRAGRLEDVEEADYDAVLDTNLKGAFFTAQAVARGMIAGGIAGRIVNIASIAGLRAVSRIGVYGMSKAGVIHMTRAMAREWGRHGINTNCLCPGYIETDMNRDHFAGEAGARLLATLPRRRVGVPADLDGALLLLCADGAARFINGAVLTADDGYVAG